MCNERHDESPIIAAIRMHDSAEKKNTIMTKEERALRKSCVEFGAFLAIRFGCPADASFGIALNYFKLWQENKAKEPTAELPAIKQKKTGAS
jgi:hypothetical protein